MSRGFCKKEKAVLYHAVSSYQLLEVMLHRRRYHRREYAVLLLPDFITEKYPWYRKLEARRFFDKVFLFPYLQIPHRSEKQVAEAALSACRAVLPYALEDFSEIYVAGAHFYFSLCLIRQGLPFVFFEDAAGMLSRPQELYRGLSARFPLHAQIAQRYGLFDGSCPLVKKIVCLKRAQTIDVSGEKYEDFSVSDVLRELPEAERSRFCRLFVRHPLRVSGDAVLLTQQLANLGITSEDGQRRLYEALRDGPLRGIRLIVKAHPDDTLDYRAIFPDAELIRQVFPSELLPYVLRGCPRTVYTLSSTGAENLSPYFRVIRLRENPEKGEYSGEKSQERNDTGRKS